LIPVSDPLIPNFDPLIPICDPLIPVPEVIIHSQPVFNRKLTLPFPLVTRSFPRYGGAAYRRAAHVGKNGSLSRGLVLQPGLFEKANNVKGLHEQTESRQFR